MKTKEFVVFVYSDEDIKSKKAKAKYKVGEIPNNLQWEHDLDSVLRTLKYRIQNIK